MIAELLASHVAPVFVFFVSSSLELTAKESFKHVLPGRRFAIERPTDQAPAAIVAGTFEDGPIPMGPYVYLSAPDRRITTVICRCSPSQVGEFVQSVYYELIPLETLRGLSSTLDRQLDVWMSGISGPGAQGSQRSSGDSSYLESQLRLPPR